MLKIFDSWAGVLDEEGFERWCVRPIKAIVDQSARGRARLSPIIAFPRGAGARLRTFRGRDGCRCRRRRLDDADAAWRVSL